MATVEDCERAINSLAARFAELDPELRSRHVVTRTLACRVPDLGVVFLALLCDGGLAELRCCQGADTDGAQVRLAADSDDLLAMVGGELSPPMAWATGRLRVQASPMDLLKLRALL